MTKAELLVLANQIKNETAIKANTALRIGTMLEELINNSAQPKRYKALISQAGENDPTASVLENTLGEVPTFSRSAVGSYLIATTGILTTNKTFVLCQQINGQDIRTDQSGSTPDSIELYSCTSVGILADGLINVSILIEVYE